MADPQNKQEFDVTPFQAGLRASCPRCGRGKLYRSLLVPADSCNHCALDYSFIDSGDGPVVFVIFVLGFLILGLAMIVETMFQPPLWVHAIMWTPAITLACLWSLRFTKALMIALQYQSKAEQSIELEKD